MKSKRIGALAAAAAGVLAGIVIHQYACADRLYPATMIVDDVRDGIVTMYTETGHMYCYAGASDEEVGDVMSVLMDSRGTAIVTDDAIVQVRYSGF